MVDIAATAVEVAGGANPAWEAALVAEPAEESTTKTGERELAAAEFDWAPTTAAVAELFWTTVAASAIEPAGDVITAVPVKCDGAVTVAATAELDDATAAAILDGEDRDMSTELREEAFAAARNELDGDAETLAAVEPSWDFEADEGRAATAADETCVTAATELGEAWGIAATAEVEEAWTRAGMAEVKEAWGIAGMAELEEAWGLAGSAEFEELWRAAVWSRLDELWALEMTR